MRNFEFQAKKIDVFSRFMILLFYFQEQKKVTVNINIIEQCLSIWNCMKHFKSIFPIPAGLDFLEFSSFSTSGERIKSFFDRETTFGGRYWSYYLTRTQGKPVDNWGGRGEIIQNSDFPTLENSKTRYCVLTFCSTKPFTFCYSRSQAAPRVKWCVILAEL